MVNRSSRVVTGVAISPTELCAADLRLRGSSGVWRTPLQPPPADGGSWSSLASAFAELARAIGATGGVLSVSLMPPLTEVRRLELPPLKDDELHKLIARNAARYFVNARGPQIVGASLAAKRVRGAPAPVVASAASARLVATIRAAAAQTGWTVESVAPAESAWAGAAIERRPEFAKQTAWVSVGSDERTDLLQLEGGRLVGVRRFRGNGADAAMIRETVGPDARITDLTKGSERPDVLAAQFAGQEAGPVLRSDDDAALVRGEARRMTWTIAAVAAGLLVLSAGIELWGVHRQLGIVRAERARIRPQIAATMIGRTTVDATSRHLAALNSIDRSSPHWSAIITTLSQAITDDAYLTAVRARGDSLIIDGLAEHASRVFDALQRSKILVDVKSAAPVRRELQEDGTALDHFTIAARVVAPPAASTSVPVSASNVVSNTRPGQ